jgi:hypothetical protein
MLLDKAQPYNLLMVPMSVFIDTLKSPFVVAVSKTIVVPPICLYVAAHPCGLVVTLALLHALTYLLSTMHLTYLMLREAQPGWDFLYVCRIVFVPHLKQLSQSFLFFRWGGIAWTNRVEFPEELAWMAQLNAWSWKAMGLSYKIICACVYSHFLYGNVGHAWWLVALFLYQWFDAMTWLMVVNEGGARFNFPVHAHHVVGLLHYEDMRGLVVLEHSWILLKIVVNLWGLIILQCFVETLVSLFGFNVGS